MLTYDQCDGLRRACDAFLGRVTPARLHKDAPGDAWDGWITRLIDWEIWEEGGRRRIEPLTLEVMKQAGDEAIDVARFEGTFDIRTSGATAWAKEHTAELVTQVGAETRFAIRQAIAYGLDQGGTIETIARRYVRPIVGLTGRQATALARFVDSGADASAVAREAARKLRYRSIMIAQTESCGAVSEAAVMGYEEAGVERVELVASADCCDLCAGLNGERYDMAEGRGVLPIHPLCRCVMVPVLERGRARVSGAAQMERVVETGQRELFGGVHVWLNEAREEVGRAVMRQAA